MAFKNWQIGPELWADMVCPLLHLRHVSRLTACETFWKRTEEEKWLTLATMASRPNTKISSIRQPYHSYWFILLASRPFGQESPGRRSRFALGFTGFASLPSGLAITGTSRTEPIRPAGHSNFCLHCWPNRARKKACCGGRLSTDTITCIRIPRRTSIHLDTGVFYTATSAGYSPAGTATLI